MIHVKSMRHGLQFERVGIESKLEHLKFCQLLLHAIKPYMTQRVSLKTKRMSLCIDTVPVGSPPRHLEGKCSNSDQRENYVS